MPDPQEHRYHPIIYVRGFAATEGEIEDTVADPYMGFNIGSTKARVAWTGKVRRFYFESPLVRLMSDHKYEDVLVEGDDLVAAETVNHPVPYRSIIIYRYYDEASKDFGDGKGTPPIERFATGLSELILKLRERVLANPKNQVTEKDFKVYLVAHSMGGLVCRALLQNPKLGKPEARAAVDKLFTYATPHNGIDMRIVRNIPGWLSFGDVNNFNRDRMADYLNVPKGDDVAVVRDFSPERIFNLIGTNPRDYAAAGGISAWAAGDASDGLVRIENAATHGINADGKDVGSPRAFVHRSHSGHYGIVNSEEGYQNLTRFLFGGLRVDGILDIDEITFPAEVQKAKDAGKNVEASYQFEVVASIRGCQWQMTRREVRENSAIFRKFKDLFPTKVDGKWQPDRTKSPHLFSIFLDPRKSVVAGKKSVSFALDLKVLVPDYEVDGALFLKRHYEGGYIFRQMIIIEAFRDDTAPGGWKLLYGNQDETPGKAPETAISTVLADSTGKPIGLSCKISIATQTTPGIRAILRIEAKNWQ